MRMIAHFIILILLLSSLCATQAVPENDPCDFSSFKPVQESDFVRKNAVLRVRPKYPAANRGQNLGMTVRVRILVSSTGEVVKICPLPQPSNSNPAFIEASVEAAKRWKFRKNFGYSKPPRSSYRDAVLVFRFIPNQPKASVQ